MKAIDTDKTVQMFLEKAGMDDFVSVYNSAIEIDTHRTFLNGQIFQPTGEDVLFHLLMLAQKEGLPLYNRDGELIKKNDDWSGNEGHI